MGISSVSAMYPTDLKNALEQAVNADDQLSQSEIEERKREEEIIEAYNDKEKRDSPQTGLLLQHYGKCLGKLYLNKGVVMRDLENVYNTIMERRKVREQSRQNIVSAQLDAVLKQARKMGVSDDKVAEHVLPLITQSKSLPVAERLKWVSQQLHEQEIARVNQMRQKEQEEAAKREKQLQIEKEEEAKKALAEQKRREEAERNAGEERRLREETERERQELQKQLGDLKKQMNFSVYRGDTAITKEWENLRKVYSSHPALAAAGINGAAFGQVTPRQMSNALNLIVSDAMLDSR